MKQNQIKNKYILGVETSHDDTSVAIYVNRTIVWEKNLSQTKFHAQYGGTVPEFAARNHVDNLSLITNELVKTNYLAKIDQIAFTAMPGLVGSLQMGYLFSQALAMTLEKPLFAINHLHGHIFAIEFSHQINFPALALIVSGGHSQIWYLSSYTDLKLLGQTKDDALGEAYDKVGRMLNLKFPGGPEIDKLAASYKGQLIDFSLNNIDNFDFSFSGLKTKILNYLNYQKQLSLSINVTQVAASFQFYAIEYVLKIFKKALEQYQVNSIILGGGVAANSYLRGQFQILHSNALIPELKYTTDNAAMIAITCDLQNNQKANNVK